MKTKKYLLTEFEISIVRDALIELNTIFTNKIPKSNFSKKYWRITKALKDQFKIDASNI